MSKQRKFIVFASPPANHAELPSVWTKAGWTRVSHATGYSAALAMTSADACKVRDDAQQNTLNKGYVYSIVEAGE